MKLKTGRFTLFRNHMELKIKDSIETSICHNLKPLSVTDRGFIFCVKIKVKDADRFMGRRD